MKKILEKAKNIIAPSVFLLPALALAQTPPAVPTSPVANVAGVGTVLCTIFGWAFYFLVILTIIFVVFAAFRYLLAAGDPEKVKSAGHILIYAAVAIVVALVAKALPAIVATLVGSSIAASC